MNDYGAQGGIPKARIDEAVQKAIDAFWAKIVEEFPEAKTGDMPPGAELLLDDGAASTVREWLLWNHPDGDSTAATGYEPALRDLRGDGDLPRIERAIERHKAFHVSPASWCPVCDRIAELESGEFPEGLERDLESLVGTTGTVEPGSLGDRLLGDLGGE